MLVSGGAMLQRDGVRGARSMWRCWSSGRNAWCQGTEGTLGLVGLVEGGGLIGGWVAEM